MKSFKLNKNKILEYQQNKPPYLMIDYATEVIPGVSAKGYKELQENEWFFKVHWQNDPNMPGMLQVEAMVQMSSLAILCLPNNKGKVMYLISADNLKFKKKVIPKSQLLIESKVKTFHRGIAVFEAKGTVNNELACKGEFKLILPDELEKYSLKK